MSDEISSRRRVEGGLPTPGEILGDEERPDGRGRRAAERLPTPSQIVAEDRGWDGPGLAGSRGIGRGGLERGLGRGR